MGHPCISQFEYRGWQVQIYLKRSTAHSGGGFARLSYFDSHLLRMRVSASLDARSCEWALCSKACDFVDAWFVRAGKPDHDAGELMP